MTAPLHWYYYITSLMLLCIRLYVCMYLVSEVDGKKDCSVVKRTLAITTVPSSACRDINIVTLY